MTGTRLVQAAQDALRVASEKGDLAGALQNWLGTYQRWYGRDLGEVYAHPITRVYLSEMVAQANGNCSDPDAYARVRRLAARQD